MLKKILLIAGVLAAGFVVLAAVTIGPRNILGMIHYGRTQEGSLRVGDRAPDVELIALDGQNRARLAESIGQKPLVLLFGSYT